MLSLLLLFTLICASSSFAFLPSSTSHRSLSPLLAVVDISDEATFDSAISGANSLVIVDYSTTWCGPCKVIAPKFEELSEQYPESIFLKVIGDSSSSASSLMKRESVRTVPAFHFFKDGVKVDVVNGANADALEQAIKKHT
ncbi:hypothetical protein TrCOL_g5079 [Triparma columacea]|uniref:Thioredoxin domain-containing protein n=1 Tax=Triparma columacea TaxID=722753 RepID=A0A9W7LAZ8_9STRA|nr:hypothetical protein TrCOL_g5079 [Triparma columacea]